MKALNSSLVIITFCNDQPRPLVSDEYCPCLSVKSLVIVPLPILPDRLRKQGLLRVHPSSESTKPKDAERQWDALAFRARKLVTSLGTGEDENRSYIIS